MEQQGTGQAQRSLEVAQLFDRLADGYDRAALRFFPFAADRLATRLVTGSNARGSNDWGPDTRVPAPWRWPSRSACMQAAGS